ncbi:hypothetical protein PUN28_005851 [Cardiocondyla obscurior]|uniref:Uncharacterized protein n=1 Tax=Cardiocondyla obscurior TaxID=286306 RepID=A0AAW2GAU8_9HYME
MAGRVTDDGDERNVKPPVTRYKSVRSFAVCFNFQKALPILSN